MSSLDVCLSVRHLLLWNHWGKFLLKLTRIIHNYTTYKKFYLWYQWCVRHSSSPLKPLSQFQRQCWSKSSLGCLLSTLYSTTLSIFQRGCCYPKSVVGVNTFGPNKAKFPTKRVYNFISSNTTSRLLLFFLNWPTSSAFKQTAIF